MSRPARNNICPRCAKRTLALEAAHQEMPDWDEPKDAKCGWEYLYHCVQCSGERTEYDSKAPSEFEVSR